MDVEPLLRGGLEGWQNRESPASQVALQKLIDSTSVELEARGLFAADDGRDSSFI
jgi:hypothetical protein